METKGSLYLRYAYNDLTGNKGVHLALLVVLTLSAFLMATGAMVMERMLGSVDELFEQARPPHFLQMHVGDIDTDALERFADRHPEIEAWHVVEAIGLDGAALSWERSHTGESGDLSDSLIDQLFTTQNEEFDLLLDETGAAPHPSPGEIHLPVAHRTAFDLRVGDVLRIATDSGSLELRVAGFVRDAQMASSLSSATRFVVSEADFETLEDAGVGAPESIVEYRLNDAGSAADLQRAYEADEALPKNGQAVTYQMIRLVNAFGDGLVAMALVFVSLLLIVIALLNVRFVIRGTLEDEVREIGAMKAIGLPDRAISGLYLTKYSVLTALACVLGGLSAIVATGLLTRGARMDYAEAPLGLASFVVPVAALALVYAFVLLLCRAVLRRVRRIEVVGALVHGSVLDEKRAARRDRRRARRVRGTALASTRGLGVNGRLALLDLRAEAGQWVLLPLVFFLATVLMTLPANLLGTFESPRFVTYMGAAESDLRADLLFSEDVDEVRDELLRSMREDERLTDVRAFSTLLYEAEGEEGWETLRVEVGEHDPDAIAYARGGSPGPGEIALSVLNADAYGLSIGDGLAVRRGGEETTLTVSGVYQDVTSGGFTAKAHGEEVTGAAGHMVYANTDPGTDAATIATEYDERFDTATVIPMREYVRQTLSQVTGALQGAALVSFVFALGVAALITGLFLRLRLTRERTRMGVLSAIGFSTGEIIAQVRGKTFLAVVVGTVLGTVFAATAGEPMVGSLLSAAGLGLAHLEFLPNPWLVYVAYPLALITTGHLIAVALTAPLRRVDKSTWLRG
ncbi:ABC transporter permease [Nocardiopsis sp. NPDC006832]|uniref:ABC transporter permease n=1 Tax=Nocardiopsis sp. NPDC006832 TaxID=3157188 RepID=UPI0033F38A3B